MVTDAHLIWPINFIFPICSAELHRDDHAPALREAPETVSVLAVWRKHPSTFKVIAVNYTEPAVLEVPFPPPVPIDEVLAAAKDFQNADACYRLETWWDLWQFDQRLEAGSVARGSVLLRLRSLSARTARIWRSSLASTRIFCRSRSFPNSLVNDPIQYQEPAQAGSRFGRCAAGGDAAAVVGIRREFLGKAAPGVGHG